MGSVPHPTTQSTNIDTYEFNEMIGEKDRVGW